MIMSRYRTQTPNPQRMSLSEKELIRLAFQLARPIRPIDAEKHLLINHRTAVHALQSLCSKGYFTAVTGASGQKIVRYEVNRGAIQCL